MRNVTGEQLAQVDNPDPFASPVWRFPVYRTPEFVIWLVQLVRLAWQVIWFALRHPLLDAAAGLVALVWLNAGWPGIAVLAAVVLAGLVVLRWGGRTGSPGWCPARSGAGGGGGSTAGTGTP